MELLGKLLGAGAGLIGTGVRAGLAVLGGWFLANGVDAGVVANFTDAVVAVVTIGLAIVGSVLNNKAK